MNVDEALRSELQIVFAILACFFSLNIIASVFTTMLTADQKPALAALVQTLGQALAFAIIYVLTKTTQGNLTYLAFAISGTPCVVLILISLYMFIGTKYRKFAPSFKHIHLSLTKSILGLGGQFFVIMISALLIFQFINIIVSRIEGPDAVTQYNIAYKYFNVINMLANIVLASFWSAFTDAYVKKDFAWMKKSLKSLEKMSLLCIPIFLLMLLFADPIYKWWIGGLVKVPFSISLCIAIYMLLQTVASVYMFLINGIGKVYLQLIIYSVFAIISIPLMILGCRLWGVEGVLIIPICVFCLQAFFGKIQINRLIANKAKGIWNK